MEYKVVETFPVRDGVVKVGEKVWWHCEEGRKITKTKHECKKPEFTFEDGVFLGKDCGPYAGYVILTMEHPDVFTVQQQIGAVHEYLKATTCQSDYSFKPLRKKLKLYIKWLQSQSSVVQS